MKKSTFVLAGLLIFFFCRSLYFSITIDDLETEKANLISDKATLQTKNDNLKNRLKMAGIDPEGNITGNIGEILGNKSAQNPTKK